MCRQYVRTTSKEQVLVWLPITCIKTTRKANGSPLNSCSQPGTRLTTPNTKQMNGPSQRIERASNLQIDTIALHCMNKKSDCRLSGDCWVEQFLVRLMLMDLFGAQVISCFLLRKLPRVPRVPLSGSTQPDWHTHHWKAAARKAEKGWMGGGTHNQYRFFSSPVKRRPRCFSTPERDRCCPANYPPRPGIGKVVSHQSPNRKLCS